MLAGHADRTSFSFFPPPPPWGPLAGQVPQSGVEVRFPTGKGAKGRGRRGGAGEGCGPGGGADSKSYTNQLRAKTNSLNKQTFCNIVSLVCLLKQTPCCFKNAMAQNITNKRASWL